MYGKIAAFFTSRSRSRRARWADERCREARAQFAQGQHAGAIDVSRQVLTLQPDHVGAILLLAEIAVADKDTAHAVELYTQALRLDPDNFLAHYKYGNLLNDIGQPEAALASYDRAVGLDPGQSRAFCNRGVVLQSLKRSDAALASYEQAIALNPGDALSHYNRGALLREMGRAGEALASYTQAIAVSPRYVEALCNRGMLLQERGDWAAALTDFDRAIAASPEFADAHASRGHALLHMRQFAAAIASYDRALALEPGIRFAAGMRLNAKMLLCDWSELEADAGVLTAGRDSNSAIATPFTALTLTDSPPLHLQAARIWVGALHPADDSLPAIAPRLPAEKVRLGYFSSDFCQHPVALLAAQFLELHDRSKYEVIGFSFGPDTHDAMRKRLEKTFDRIVDVRETSDRDVALLARALGIDIAIDLNGHTAGSRTGIFSRRAAPVQISFLGYPGTMGAGYIDYLIGDATVIPEENRQYYSEKILYLPDSFLPYDSGRAIAPQRFTREQLGLPPNGMVFCCFNNSYKILPGTFDIWMKILRRIDDSVLWLSHNDVTAVENLRREAQSRGVEPRRLIFAERMPSAAEHLARLRAADLFLDTLPYNAHATALDALWSGVPLLTRIGQGFAGRVAASLLKSVGLPELITSTAAQYEGLAVELAQDPQRLAALKLTLERNLATTPLFDTPRFTRNLERAYGRAFERYQAGLPPEHIDTA